MQIVDLRQTQARNLDPLFQEETRHWRDELHWDYRSSIELIRRFIDSRSLGGYVAMEDGNPAGYGFYVLEDPKGLIGGLFVSSRFSQEPITRALVMEMVTALHATPRLERVEAQLMPFGTELDPIFLSQYFKLYTRQFMLLTLTDAKLGGAPLSTGLRLEPWTDRAFESAARLIQLAYADHVDGRTAHRHGAHIHCRRARGSHDANLRDARISGPRHRPRVDGKLDTSAAPSALRFAFAHRDQY